MSTREQKEYRFDNVTYVVTGVFGTENVVDIIKRLAETRLKEQKMDSVTFTESAEYGIIQGE